MVVEKATLEEISLCMRLWDFFFMAALKGTISRIPRVTRTLRSALKAAFAGVKEER